MSNPIYEAAVYTREVTYRNFKGEESTVEVSFALDPVQLLEVIAKTPTQKLSKSGDPRKRGQVELDEGRSFTFLRDIANQAAGYPSQDGERWLPITDFLETLAGQAFVTKLASSDADRKEFAEKVMLAPFRAFVGYAKADPGNTPKEIAKFEQMLEQFERVFAVSAADETLEARRARVAQEMEELNRLAEGDDA